MPTSCVVADMALITETMKETMSGPEFNELSESQRILCRFLYLAGAYATLTSINAIDAPTEADAEKELSLLVQDVAQAFADASNEIITTHMLHTLPSANQRPS